jgi:nitroreductase
LSNIPERSGFRSRLERALADSLMSQGCHVDMTTPGSVTRGATLFSIQDATIAAAYAQLAATALNLASCWVGAFDDARVAAILGAPSRLRPVALMPIGQPAEKLKPRSRRPLSELVKHEHV